MDAQCDPVKHFVALYRRRNSGQLAQEVLLEWQAAGWVRATYPEPEAPPIWVVTPGGARVIAQASLDAPASLCDVEQSGAHYRLG